MLQCVGTRNSVFLRQLFLIFNFIYGKAQQSGQRNASHANVPDLQHALSILALYNALAPGRVSGGRAHAAQAKLVFAAKAEW